MLKVALAFGMVLVLACSVTQPRAPSPPVTAAPATLASTPQPADSATPRPLPRPSATITHRPLLTDTPADTPTESAAGVPRPDHVVIVLFENQPYSQIFGNACCAYLNQQAKLSALMTRSFAVTHPSQPNYINLFSGSDQGVTDDSCPPPGSPFTTPNLGQELLDAGLTFTGFAEDLPAPGSMVCSTDTYGRKHSPWTDFSNVPSEDNLPFSSFPTDYSQLPTLSFVIPNLCHDMHDCDPSTGDAWLSSQLDSYIQWAMTNNSLLIVTFDEDDYYGSNQVLTFFEGQMVKPGRYREHITHFNVLRTLEEMYGLPHAGQAANVATITDIWNGPASPTP